PPYRPLSVPAHPQPPRDINEKPTSKPRPHQTVTSQVGLHLAVGFEKVARVKSFGAVTFEEQGVVLRRGG
ncbi:MAG: hypothetical protein ACFNZX_06435, partial [Actinomyces sp.]